MFSTGATSGEAWSKEATILRVQRIVNTRLRKKTDILADQFFIHWTMHPFFNDRTEFATTIFWPNLNCKLKKEDTHHQERNSDDVSQSQNSAIFFQHGSKFFLPTYIFSLLSDTISLSVVKSDEPQVEESLFDEQQKLLEPVRSVLFQLVPSQLRPMSRGW